LSELTRGSHKARVQLAPRSTTEIGSSLPEARAERFAKLRPTYDARILIEKRRGLCPVTLLPGLFGIPSKSKRIVYCNNLLFEFHGQYHLLWNGK
jgi:hypothetical protein